MEVTSDSPRAKHAQKLIVELLASDVPDRVYKPDSELAIWKRKLGIGATRFPSREQPKADLSHPAMAVNLGDRRARLAIEIFVQRIKKYIGAYLAAMNGADAVLFAGGIGENSPEIRSRICRDMEWCGLRIDEERNHSLAAGKEGEISAEGSKLRAYVIPTDEELLIARDTARLVERAEVPGW